MKILKNILFTECKLVQTNYSSSHLIQFSELFHLHVVTSHQLVTFLWAAAFLKEQLCNLALGTN